MKPLRIAVLYNLPTRRAIASPYADTEKDTIESAQEVLDALKAKGHIPELFAVDEDHIDTIDTITADCIFNLIEWTGLDMPLVDHVFAHIESLGIPYTGATRENYVTTADKRMMKKLFDTYDLPTARWQVFTDGTESVRPDFQYPVIIKPALEHCSIGLTHEAVVNDEKTLKTRVAERITSFAQPVVVEEFIIGREFQVTVLQTDSGLRVLPPSEVVFDTKGADALLTYDSRWDESAIDYKVSHMRMTYIDPQLDAIIRKVALSTFTRMGFRDYTRLDIRTRGNDVYILEANSNPGLGDHEEYGMTLSYKAVGMTFADIVTSILDSTMRRFKQEKAA
jgi:D-alanine-D-alanine ligase